MIVLLIIILLAVIGYVIYESIQKKYKNFVTQNSIAFEKICEINNLYSFNSQINFDQSNTYDNENFYNNISCKDYLIYQLQFLSSQINKEISNINHNKQQYQNYVDKVKSVEYGLFKCSYDGFDYEKLLKFEKEIVNKVIKRPTTSFSITVTLYCSKINGEVYSHKRATFSAEETSSFIKRLKNKTANFYNDRDIWDSICRVERGKVSNKMRFSIYERDGYRCRRCGATQTRTTLEIDHIIPIAKGGKSTYNNLQTLCSRCNYEKGDKI